MSKNVLNVPFLEKDIAKALGAKWDSANKYWYVPDGLDLLPFARWMTDKKCLNFNDKNEETSNKTLLVFLSEVAQILLKESKNKDWITAEISQISRHKSGHYYLDLVQHNEQGIVVAKTSAIIWKELALDIDRKFSEVTNSKLKSDIKVMLLVKIQFDLVHGLKLIIQDIEPAYTLGDMAVKLREIRQKLIAEKIIALNKRQRLENEYNNIAVIAPFKGAGLGDFKKEAEVLSKFNLCSFDYYYASFQGRLSALEIKDKILEIQNQHSINPYDMIVIIRGGGAVTDLAWLNDYELARSICLSKLPIVSGIGHRKDSTIIDEVSNRNFDTPSKVSTYIYNTVLNEANNFKKEFKKVIELIERKISYTQNHVALIVSEIKSTSLSKTLITRTNLNNKFDKFIVQQNNQIILSKINISSLFENQIVREMLNYSAGVKVQLRQVFLDYYNELKKSILFARQDTELLVNKILGQDPNEIIKKGFAIAKSEDGVSITSCASARICRQFLLQFKDGTMLVNPVIEKSNE